MLESKGDTINKGNNIPVSLQSKYFAMIFALLFSACVSPQEIRAQGNVSRLIQSAPNNNPDKPASPPASDLPDRPSDTEAKEKSNIPHPAKPIEGVIGTDLRIVNGDNFVAGGLFSRIDIPINDRFGLFTLAFLDSPDVFHRSPDSFAVYGGVTAGYSLPKLATTATLSVGGGITHTSNRNEPISGNSLATTTEFPYGVTLDTFHIAEVTEQIAFCRAFFDIKHRALHTAGVQSVGVEWIPRQEPYISIVFKGPANSSVRVSVAPTGNRQDQPIFRVGINFPLKIPRK